MHLFVIRTYFSSIKIKNEKKLNDSIRLGLLKEARMKSGMTLDFWDELTVGLDQSALEILVGRSDVFPKYRNSKVSL